MGISYRKHDNGQWEYRISYADPVTAKRKEKSKRGFKSKPEARYAAQEMEKKLLEGLEESDVSLKHFINEWLYEYKKPILRKNTFEIHKRNIENHILPYFKEIQLKKIKPIMYQKFINYLVEKGYSKRTVEIVHGTMYSALDKAVTLQKLENNPCNGAVITTTKSTKEGKIQYLNSNQVPLFLQECYQYDYIYWIFFKTLVETGMRKGEAAALQWNDIDLKEAKITISKTLDFSAKNDDELFGETKTYHSARTITMGTPLAKVLHEHKKWQNQNKIVLNEVYKHDLNLVLCRKDGSHMPKSTLFNAFRRILKRCDISPLPIHALRHTHAVILLESGASIKYIQERLGHGSMQITADVYSHISEKLERSTIDKYDEYMSKLEK
ncbi:site-specific integrase [Bacillus sp. FJAT-45037]|uniref:site-specific integrase n=1 Tax=Bacillus sp. FJAT-45037 TaxID=2011007 RepID=UPI000C23F0B5|nr:site-specific integrase [Bacillus sp. FJAT-45037]